MRRLIAVVCLGVLVPCTRIRTSELPSEFRWPQISCTQKPWSYWWWPGSAVDKDNLSRLLSLYRAGGLGGVHIIPIYGVRGWEESYRKFLSPSWLEALAHTVKEARRLGLGVDMSTGTGWPFGGPQVSAADAAEKVVFKTAKPSEDGFFEERLKGGRIEAVCAFGPGDRFLDLSKFVDSEGRITWRAPEQGWRVYAVLATRTGQRVKRAAPGGEGWVVDPFSRKALQNYLKRFDEAFSRYRGPMPRAQYHDSYEYYRADWTDGFLTAFRNRFGYDLRRELPALSGHADRDRTARVKADWRNMLSDLLLEEYIRPWVSWSHTKGCLARNQAHGSPGNLLDLYAACDIPETEIFGPSRFKIRGLRTDPDFKGAPPDPLMLKFASSAAHTRGRRLVSSETCTWLGEHFKVALSQVKPEIDQLLTSGINHIFYHGIAYSPCEAPWPGWLFYASTNFAPSNPFWTDFPELNAYVARCQSILQTGEPANDVLLYFPVNDIWHNPEGTVIGLLPGSRTAEVERMLHEPISTEELNRAIKQSRAQFAYSSESVTGQAYWLGWSEIFAEHTWFENYLQRINAVTPQDVQRVAAQYLQRSNRTVGWYVPQAEQETRSA